MNEEIKTPLIAILVSERITSCEDFLRHNGLNKACFKLARRKEELHGMDKHTPVIVLGRIDDMFLFWLVHRFYNVRIVARNGALVKAPYFSELDRIIQEVNNNGGAS